MIGLIQKWALFVVCTLSDDKGCDEVGLVGRLTCHRRYSFL